MKRILIAVSLILLPMMAPANSVGSGTMEFEGTLTDAGGGIYTGAIDATAGSWYVDGGGGEAISTAGGFDVYALEGGCAFVQGYYGTGAWNCSGTDTYVIGYGSADPHDGYPDDGTGNPPWGDYWDPDVPDYYNYELVLTTSSWALQYKGDAQGTPMSGIMDWGKLYASENDVGSYTGTVPNDPDANDGDAAAHGAGAGWWDMDWTWGSDAIPLELAGFDVSIDDLGGGSYHITFTPADPDEVWVDDDFDASTPGWGVTHFATIQDGIDAVSGSTVNVAAGTYNEAILIDKALSLTGADGAILDGTGLGLVTGVGIQSGNVTFDNIDVLNFGGNGMIVGYEPGGPGNLQNVEIRNSTIAHIQPGSSHGFGIYVGYESEGFGYNPPDLTDFLDYSGLVIEDNEIYDTAEATMVLQSITASTGVLQIRNNYMHDAGVSALWIDCAREILVEGNQMRACRDGVYFSALADGYYVPDTVHAPMDVQILDNQITDQISDDWWTGHGIILFAGWPATFATEGNEITGNELSGVTNYLAVDVDARGNWWGDVSGPYHPTLNPGGLGDTVSDYVLFEPWTGMADIAIVPATSGPINCSQSQVLTFHYTPDAMTPDLRGYSVTFDPDIALSMTEGDVTELEDFDLFDVTDNGDGTFTVDGAMYTGTLIDYETDLFSVEVHGFATGTANVEITDYYLRDANNDDFFGVMHDAVVEVDCIDPPAVTDLATATGHEKVDLTWAMADASDVDHYEIWRAVWHTGDNITSAYPEYDDVNATEPIWPADHTAAVASPEWTLVSDTVAGAATGYTDNHSLRGIYYYEVYAVDAASNFSAGAGPSNRATNYWLADVAPTGYDGYVDVSDISKLGAAYGSDPSDGTPPYNNEADVGPTDDHSGTGIPATDNYIGFEDMMIFALNFSVVGPMPIDQQGAEIAQLAWVPLNAHSGALHLLEACNDFKALHMEMALPKGVEVTLSEGDLLGGQAAPIFLENIKANGLDVSLGVMGSGMVLHGEGELFRLDFSEDVELADLEIDMRDVSNDALEFSFEITGIADTPSAYALLRNYPNPFNPKTTIRFDLPERQAVNLVIFDVTGRRIATLVDEALDAGYHSVDWYGRDDQGVELASGIYFYRIKAGPLDRTERMVLLK